MNFLTNPVFAGIYQSRNPITGELIFPAGRYVDLDPSLISGAEGSEISTALDGSGNDRHATGATGKKPLLETIDGIKTYKFDFGKYFQLGNYSALGQSTIFIVFKKNYYPDSGNGETFGFWTLGTSGDEPSFVPFSNGTIYDGAGRSLRTDAVNTGGHDFYAWTVYAVRASNHWANFLNGEKLREETGVTVAYPTNANIGISLYTYYHLFANVARFLIFDEALSDEEIEDFSNALMNFYSDLF